MFFVLHEYYRKTCQVSRKCDGESCLYKQKLADDLEFT